MSENLENLNRTRPSLTGFTGLYTELADGLNAVVNIDEEGNYVGPLDGVLPFVTVGFGSGFDYVCDGVADDVQINAAITAVNAAGGGEVRFAAGTYNTVATILLKSKVALVGAGIQKTIIKGSTSDYKVLATTKSGTTKDVYNNISLSNLTVLSQKGHCTNFNNIDTLSVTDCEFYFSGTTTIRESLWCQHCKNVQFSDNYLHDLTGDGVQINSTDYFIVSNNTVDGGTNADDGIDVDFDFLDTSSISSNYGSVVGNVIRNITKGDGIRVENSSFVTVDGNAVSDVSGTTGNIAGIQVNVTASNTAKNVTISGNTLSNCVSNGIMVGGDGGVVTNLSGVVVTGNSLSTCGQAGGSNTRAGIQIFANGTICTSNSLDTCGKSGTDSASILVYKASNVDLTANKISNSATGIRFWNGDGLQSYQNVNFNGNFIDTTVTTPIVGAVVIGGFSVSVGFSNADYLVDGTADDVQINAAITAVSNAGGGVVNILPGTYSISAVIVPKTKVHLIGSGESTTLFLANSTNTDVIANATGGLEDITISNLVVDGNRTNQTGGTALINLAGNSTLLKDIFVDKVVVKNSYRSAIFIHGDTTNRYEKAVTNCYIENHGSGSVIGYGIYVDYAPNTRIQGNTIKTSNGNDAIEMGHLGEIYTEGNYIVDGPIQFPFASNSIIANNILKTGAIFNDTNDADNMIITGNQVLNATPATGYAGIRVAGDNAVITNNYVKVTTQDGISGIAGHVNIQITNNTIDGTNSTTGATNGIRQNGVAGFIANGNIIRNCVRAINLNNDDAVVNGNFATSCATGLFLTDSSVSGHVNLRNLASANNFNGCTTPFNANNQANGYSILQNYGINPKHLHPQGNVTGATTFTRANGDVITATLTGSITVTLTDGLVKGDELTLVLTQDGTGGRTATWPSNAKFALGNSALSLTPAPSAVDTITFEWDGTNWREKNRAMWIRTPRTVTMADATSFTMTGDTADINVQTNTQAIGTLTANAPSGTPVNGQLLQLELKCTNVQTFSWNAIFASSNDVVLPTASTGSSKTDLMLFRYNSTATKWYIVAKSLGY